jgi:hypothetical protein
VQAAHFGPLAQKLPLWLWAVCFSIDCNKFLVSQETKIHKNISQRAS